MAVTALVFPVSGPYAGSWNGFLLGVQNDDGFVLTGQYTGQEVNQSDVYGMTLVEAIWRGINWRLRFRGLEWGKPGILAAIQMFGATTASPNIAFAPALSNVGQRYSAFAQSLVLNSILGAYPPAFPTGLTALGAVLAPNSNTEAMMTSKVREAPLEMVLLPYTVGNNNVAFTTT